MGLRDGNGRRRSDVRALAEAKIKDIDDRLLHLGAMREALTGLVESCSCGRGRPVCPILEALDGPHERIPR